MKRPTLAVFGCLTATTAAAKNKVTSAAKDAVDPNCTVEKAAKRAAITATVGVVTSCGSAEAPPDVTSVDGKSKDVKRIFSN